jgi:hypothetical protein
MGKVQKLSDCLVFTFQYFHLYVCKYPFLHQSDWVSVQFLSVVANSIQIRTQYIRIFRFTCICGLYLCLFGIMRCGSKRRENLLHRLQIRRIWWTNGNVTRVETRFLCSRHQRCFQDVREFLTVTNIRPSLILMVLQLPKWMLLVRNLHDIRHLEF